MIPTALAVLAGIVGLQLLADLPAAWVAVPLAAGTILCLYRRSTRPLAWVLGAFLWAWWQAGLQLDRDLPPELEGADLILRGTVASLPEVDGRATRFIFESRQRAEGADWIAFERRLRLSWYADTGEVPALTAGTAWQLTVRLKRRHGFHNPGGFDYEGWLFQNGLSATGYVRPRPPSLPLPETGTATVLRLRAAVDARLGAVLAGNGQAGLLRALALGASDGIAAADWDVLRATGTGHLVAISGLHIGLVAGMAFGAVRRLWSRSAALTLRLAAPRAAALAGFAAATLYALLAGFGIPVRRAWIMAGVMLLGLALRRRGDPWQGLALALLLVTLTDPLAVNSPGFWLSFAAVAIIFAGLARATDRLSEDSRSDRLRRQCRSLVQLQLLLSFGLLPFTLGFFGQFGWTAPIANLLAVPWTSFVIVPLVFIGLLLLPLPAVAGWVFDLAGWAAVLLQHWLVLLAGQPGSLLGMPAAPLAVSLLAGLGFLCLLLPRGVPGRLLGLALLVPLLSWQPPQPAAGSAWLTLLDVGQGLAAVVRTRHHVLVYDAGPWFSPDFDAGQAVVAPFLEAQGLRHIDALIVSHGDLDHRGGARSLDSRLPAYRLLTSVPERIDWRYSGRCRAGQRWAWDGVTFHMLHPDPGDYSRGNDASCVLQVRAASGDSALLPGDIEAAAELALVRRHGAELASAVLIAPHHGSRSSSTPDFIAAVAPRWVLFPVGYRNRYGFPRAEVSARYRAHGSRLLTSAGSGAIELRLGEGGAELRPTQHRRLARRYWQPPPEIPVEVPPDQ